ncbi:MAG: type II toxin-antitoxin system YoeB family toxin [Oscillospiraceae bacterium]|jgi:toxin YoeB|nr:type II toxin-antitoxin system YoeB family toxin [Oscillospiraceae bacterium]
MAFNLTFADNSWNEYHEAEKKDRETIDKLIKSILRNNPVQQPEALKYNYSGWFSLKINKKDRLIYRIVDNSAEIISCKGHYDDK